MGSTEAVHETSEILSGELCCKVILYLGWIMVFDWAWVLLPEIRYSVLYSSWFLAPHIKSFFSIILPDQI